jgi:hypothetical protein
LTVKRRYLTEREIERLMDCARKFSRRGHRDATMILMAYRHGLRASEVCDLQWQQIELSEGRLHVHRVKGGIPSVHPIRGDEMRALRKLRRDYPKDAYVFVSERGGPIGPIGFHRLIQRLGETAKMPFPIHATCSVMPVVSSERRPRQVRLCARWRGDPPLPGPVPLRADCGIGLRHQPFDLRLGGSSTTGGAVVSTAMGSTVPSISLAWRPAARRSNLSWISAMYASICSVDRFV